MLENKLSENLVFKEFEEIPKKVQSAECTVAKLPENETRNRFRDVLPYDITRVKLTPRKDNHSGYINGSHIKVSLLSSIKLQSCCHLQYFDVLFIFYGMVIYVVVIWGESLVVHSHTSSNGRYHFRLLADDLGTGSGCNSHVDRPSSK